MCACAYHRHGKGIESWPDGREYEGVYQFDKKHGRGLHLWQDGARYEGEYQLDLRFVTKIVCIEKKRGETTVDTCKKRVSAGSEVRDEDELESERRRRVEGESRGTPRATKFRRNRAVRTHDFNNYPSAIPTSFEIWLGHFYFLYPFLGSGGV